MDYSEVLIAIQAAKDKAAQACRERDWSAAYEAAVEARAACYRLQIAIGDERRKAT